MQDSAKGHAEQQEAAEARQTETQQQQGQLQQKQSLSSQPSLQQQRSGQQQHHHQRHQLGHAHHRKAGDKVHFCVNCSCPIAVYGRMYPCLHTYCLTCATDMEKCLLCGSGITRIERIQRTQQALYISPTTLQSFKNEDDLKQHTKKAYQQLLASDMLKQALSVKRPPAAPAAQGQPAHGSAAATHAVPAAHMPPVGGVPGLQPLPPMPMPGMAMPFPGYM